MSAWPHYPHAKSEHVYDGVTCRAAQGDKSTAALEAKSGRLRLDNGTRFANNRFRVGLAEVIYVLPAPQGRYTNARKCEVVYAPCPDGDSCKSKCNQDKSLNPAATTSGSCTQPPYNIQPCPWNINLTAFAFGESILGLMLEKLLPGTYGGGESGASRSQWPVPCSPGLLGATVDSIDGRGQLSALCAGLCPAGYYCPDYATTVAISCTQGHYCPPGASAPLPCAEGSYSTRTDLISATQCNATEPGFYATTGSKLQTPCSPGTVQPNASMTMCVKCDEGKYQAGKGQQICETCRAGNYTSNVLSCEPCPVGEYCPDGLKREDCPIGSTTEGNGSASYDDCGCRKGTYNNTAAPGKELTCTSCSDDMSCKRAGLSLATVPLLPHRWRHSVTDCHIRTWEPQIGADLVLASRGPSEPHRRYRDMRHFRQRIRHFQQRIRLPRRRERHQVRHRPPGAALRGVLPL